MSTRTCPTTGEQLIVIERNGIEIDYCPTCRGVWLDRGELDKLIEMATAAAGQAAAAPAQQPPADPLLPPASAYPAPPPYPAQAPMPPQAPMQPQGYAPAPVPPQGYAPGYGHPMAPPPPPPGYGAPGHYHSGQQVWVMKKKKHKNFLDEIFDFD